MTESQQFIIRSEKFRIDLGEDAETNPFHYGRQLAEWLRAELSGSNYDLEDVIPEDWGWCVMCRRGSFRLFVGLVNAVDQNLIDCIANEEPPNEVQWHIHAIAEAPFWRGTAIKKEAESSRRELEQKLQEILGHTPEIELLTETEIEEWFSAEPEEFVVPDQLMPKPARIPRWVTLPLGLLLLPIVILCFFGGIALFIDPPKDLATAWLIIGTIVLAASFGLAVIVVRLITGKEGPYGGLFPPIALRGLALLFGAMPIGLVFTGFYSDGPVRGIAGAFVYVMMAVGIWRTASRRIDRARATQK